MEKFASVVEQRLVQALKEDARQEEKVRFRPSRGCTKRSFLTDRCCVYAH